MISLGLETGAAGAAAVCSTLPPCAGMMVNVWLTRYLSGAESARLNSTLTLGSASFARLLRENGPDRFDPQAR